MLRVNQKSLQPFESVVDCSGKQYCEIAEEIVMLICKPDRVLCKALAPSKTTTRRKAVCLCDSVVYLAALLVCRCVEVEDGNSPSCTEKQLPRSKNKLVCLYSGRGGGVFW